jgi:hypothetical protein
MTPTPVDGFKFGQSAVLSNLRHWKHALLPSAIFGACVGALESLIKGGAARAIFVTVCFVLFVALANRRKLN